MKNTAIMQSDPIPATLQKRIALVNADIDLGTSVLKAIRDEFGEVERSPDTAADGFPVVVIEGFRFRLVDGEGLIQGLDRIGV